MNQSLRLNLVAIVGLIAELISGGVEAAPVQETPQTSSSSWPTNIGRQIQIRRTETFRQG